MNEKPISYTVIRGQLIETDLLEFGGRAADVTYLAPDPQKLVELLPLGSPSRLQDLYDLSLEDIFDYLAELGSRLDVRKNEYMAEARELSYLMAPTTKPVLDMLFAGIPVMFDRDRVRRSCEFNIGIAYLEGWVEKAINGSNVAVRAYGARTLHIVAGNGPVLGALSILRGAVTRSDTIIKVPSNDPFTTAAIVRTMRDFAPNHPVTRHTSVAYWRGGDEAFENRLYQPHCIEKIVAWGGLASVKHVTRYIQPGLELISLDPKRSASILGGEVFKSESLLQEAARRVATDVRAWNQEACSSCRIVYVMCGTDEDGINNLRRLGEMVYRALMALPASLSTKAKNYDRDLQEKVDSLRLNSDWFAVIGGKEGEGAVLVSHTADPVEFFEFLAHRTVNLVPVDTLDEVMEAVDAYTQTVGIFPDDLLEQLRHRVALHGGQRVVSLGYAFNGPGAVGPQDGIEPMRRMCKWIVTERPLPDVKPLWECTEDDVTMIG